MSKGLTFAVVIAAGALALTACGSKPTDSTSSSGSGTAATYKACMVTDTGGIDDRSFNASAWKGMQDAATATGASVKYLESKASSDYTPNINALISEKCNLIVTVGFLMGDATKAAAKANPSTDFAIVDEAPVDGLTNYKALEFNTAQSSFQAGYLAASVSTTGTVGTFGGLPIPTVTIFMDGFVDGVAYYNTQKGKSVKVLGWDEATQKGSFVGGQNPFTDQAKGKSLADGFIQQGADVIFPVAGGSGLGAVGEAQATKKAVAIWVDQDGYLTAPQFKDTFLSTVVKGVDASVTATVKEGVEGKFNNTPYVGTLENGGTLLAPFHDLEAKVSADTKSELEAIRKGIIDGSITIASPSQPKS